MDNKKGLKKFIDVIQKGIPEQVIIALEELSKIGNLSIIPELLNLLIIEKIHSNKMRITEFISNVHDEAIVEIKMQYIRNFENIDKLVSITPCIWNSKHDFSRYIADFVSLATEGDYLLALECLTIIEQMNGPFEESWLLESQLYLKEYVERDSKKDERKDIIISDIASIIKEQNNSVDADLMME